VHDFHLIGVARELRSRGVTQPLGFFLHTPFPSKQEFFTLLQRRPILYDLLAYDVVGFQTATFENNFIDAVRAFVPDARIQVGADGIAKINCRGYTTRLGSFPISIDTDEFQNQLCERATQRNISRLLVLLQSQGCEKMLFSAGRLDYSKGFFEELQAFDLLLENHPELIDSIMLYQLVIPSRNSIAVYRDYKERIRVLASSINKKYGKRVVRQVHRPMSRASYLAYLNVASINSVPTKADGMNLIAKEWAVVGNPSAVLLLGHKAGAAEELGQNALLIEPGNTAAFAAAIYSALTMNEDERQRRKRMLKRTVTLNDIFNWASEQESVFQMIWNERADRQ
jgi:trehalose 6-phosphate synthase